MFDITREQGTTLITIGNMKIKTRKINRPMYYKLRKQFLILHDLLVKALSNPNKKQ